MRALRPDAPQLANQMIGRSLQKDPASRYQTASEMIREGSELPAQISSASESRVAKRRSRTVAAAAMAALLLTVVAAGWFVHRSSKKQWAREEAVPKIASFVAEGKPLAAFDLLGKAQSYLPDDPKLKQLAGENTLVASVTSSPAGATAAIQDYSTPDGPWRVLGVTPLQGISLPKGYFRWKLSSLRAGDLVEGAHAEKIHEFCGGARSACLSPPAGMVRVPGENWGDMIVFIGVGWSTYPIPTLNLDRFEVSNRDYQKFVDGGGYERKEYWNEKFLRDGREISWAEAMAQFRDTTNRPGPAGWVGGHYGEGKVP